MKTYDHLSDAQLQRELERVGRMTERWFRRCFRTCHGEMATLDDTPEGQDQGHIFGFWSILQGRLCAEAAKRHEERKARS